MSTQTVFGDSSGVIRKTRKIPFADLTGVQRSTKTGWLCRPEDGVVRKIFQSGIAYTASVTRKTTTVTFSDPVPVSPSDHAWFWFITRDNYTIRASMNIVFANAGSHYWSGESDDDEDADVSAPFSDAITQNDFITEIFCNGFYVNGSFSFPDDEEVGGSFSIGGKLYPLTTSGEIEV